MTDSLYKRLGGYDAITAVADDLLARLTADDSSAGSGKTAAWMACGARNSCWSIFCARRRADRFTMPAAT